MKRRISLTVTCLQAGSEGGSEEEYIPDCNMSLQAGSEGGSEEEYIPDCNMSLQAGSEGGSEEESPPINCHIQTCLSQEQDHSDLHETYPFTVNSLVSLEYVITNLKSRKEISKFKRVDIAIAYHELV